MQCLGRSLQTEPPIAKIRPLLLYQLLILSTAQVAWVVTNSKKNLTERHPHGMIDTYGGYLKTSVPKSQRQGGARDQAVKFLLNRVIWDPQRSIYQPKL